MPRLVGPSSLFSAKTRRAKPTDGFLYAGFDLPNGSVKDFYKATNLTIETTDNLLICKDENDLACNVLVCEGSKYVQVSKGGKMKKLVMLLLMIAPLSAGAVVVNSSIGSYDVTSTVTTGNNSALTGTAWWGSSARALEFADLVGGSLGLPNLGSGPLFAYGSNSNLFGTFTLYAVSLAGLVEIEFFTGSNQTATYALSRPVGAVGVPEPGALALLGAGLLGLGLLRRRRAAA